jgi:hypothetical protein
MSIREFLDSPQEKWAWRRAFALLTVVAVSIVGYFAYRVVESYEPLAPEIAEPSERPSVIPNGGLVAVEESLEWGETWEGQWRDWPDITLTNPTDCDLHVSIDTEACPLSVYEKHFTVPAGQQVTLGVGSSHPGRTYHHSREPTVDMELPFTIRIDEFPGTHPGWFIRARVQRAVAVDEVQRDRSYEVTPLRPIAEITADINGDASCVEVTGPDFNGRYLVTIDPRSLPAVEHAGEERERSVQLVIHTDVDGEHTTRSCFSLRL